ncbi:MAG: hypothetical protein WC889_04600 [Myxococcota bacterium]|jgi:hypothetical protein
MTDLNFVADLIEARAHQYGSSYTAIQDESWEVEQALCSAQSQALREVAREIRASIPSQGTELSESRPELTRTWWVFSTEIGGVLSARLFTDQEAAEDAKVSFMQKYRMKGEYVGYAACGINTVDIAPRRTKAPGKLDCRYALVMYDMHITETSIHEDEEELEKAIEEFKIDHDYDNDAGSSLYDCHKILLPK